MKYTFKLEDGREAVVKFKHLGKRRGRAPKSTRCRIMMGEEVISEAWARPAAEIAVIIRKSDWLLDKRLDMSKLIKKVKTYDGSKIAILRGDQFCRLEGRTVSFRKALDRFPMVLYHSDKCAFTSAMIEQGAVKS
jgi:hypothetical protein